MKPSTFWFFIFRERSLAIIYLIFALINDWVNSKAERLRIYLIIESCLKFLLFLDICGCTAFCWLKKSLEEKLQELERRLREERDFLNALEGGDSPFMQQMINIRNLWRGNIIRLNRYININNIDNNRNNLIN